MNRETYLLTYEPTVGGGVIRLSTLLYQVGREKNIFIEVCFLYFTSRVFGSYLCALSVSPRT